MTEPTAPADPIDRIIVADAGPLIHLDELQCLGLLADFAEVRVPDAVWREVDQHRPAALGFAGIRLVRSLSAPSERVAALSTLFTLHSGEREALSLCLELPNALLLTDDTAARLAAQALEIQARGTIGLLVRALHRRQLSKADVIRVLSEIPQRSTLHIRAGLLADIIRQVAGSPDIQ